MQELSIANIEVIESEVVRSGITFSHLREELVDHICCEVENYMQLGLDFEHAFEKIRGTIGNKGLKKVQEDTILLIDKKYRIMKRTMRITGLISMAMMALGAIFKIQHYPGAGPLLVLSFALMSFVFLPSALYVMKKEITMKGSTFIFVTALVGGICLLIGMLFKLQHYPGAGIMLLLGFLIVCIVLIPALIVSKLRDENAKKLHAVYILGGLSISIYLLGDLFKIQHYPGAGPLLMLGAVMLTTVFLPIYGYKVYRNTTFVKGGFIYLCIGVFFFNLFNILLAMNVSKDVISYYLKPGKEISSTATIMEQKNIRLMTLIVNDSISKDTSVIAEAKKIETMTKDLFGFIEKLKFEVIMKVDGCTQSEAEAKAQNPPSIMAKDNFDIPSRLLFGESPDGSKGKARELKMKLEAYKETLLKSCINSDDAKKIISGALETKDMTDMYGNQASWELYHFYNLMTIAVINKLGYFQRNIFIAESQALQCLATLNNRSSQKN